MKRPRLCEVREFLEDCFYGAVNQAFVAKYCLDRLRGRYGFLKENCVLKDKHKGGHSFIVGNAPSAGEQDLKPLKDEITFFVNRAFQHPDYEYIKPTYHILVDGKMATGVWPVRFLDEILEKNPHVTLLLNAHWYYLPQFQPYKKQANICWIMGTLTFTPFTRFRRIDLTRITHSYNVVEQGISAALYMGLKTIYFTGVEGNGLFYQLIGKDSHYYGNNTENLTMDTREISRSLSSGSRWLRGWCAINGYCEQHGVDLVNLTRGGIMDMTRRECYEDVVMRLNKAKHS